MYEVYLSREAEKYYLKSPPPVQRRFNQIIDRLERNPFYYLVHIKKMAGAKNKYRYREGDYRVVYYVDKKKKRVDVIAIRGRGDWM